MVDEAEVEKSFWLSRPDGYIGPDLPASPGRLERRGLERVGKLLRSRTSCPLYIYCKFFIFLPSILSLYIRLSSPPG